MYKHTCACFPFPFYTQSKEYKCADCGQEDITNQPGQPFMDWLAGTALSHSYDKKWQTGWLDSDTDITGPLSQEEIDALFKDFEREFGVQAGGWKPKECECGAKKTSNPNLHAHYCPKYTPYK